MFHVKHRIYKSVMFHVKHWGTMNLKEELQSNNICVSDAELSMLMKHLELVIDANTRVQLTTIKDLNNGIRLHIVDSLTCLQEVNNAPEGALLDMGTGGGFPGIPLAIASNRPVTLLDSVKKKCAVLETFINELNLGNVCTAPFRAEELALEEPKSFAVITARALSSLPSLVELASPLLKEGGILVAQKGNITNDELLRGDKAAKMVGMVRTSLRRFTLSGADEHRSIIVYKKSGASKRKLPRRPGMAQRQPLA